jgi:type IV secretory pathway component VirB8
VELDIVDKVINDLKSYNRSLVYEDTALARQIEDYLKKRESIDKKKQNSQSEETEVATVEETSSKISDDFFDRPPDYLFEDEKVVLDY